MTLTRGWRQTLTIAMVVLIASVLLGFGGNQRQAQAQVSGDDITHSVFCLLNGIGEPVNIFDDECEEEGGEVIDWCPSLPGDQSESDLPCIDYCPDLPGIQAVPGCGDDEEGPVDVCTNEETDPGVQESGPCNADDVCPNDDGIQTSTEDCTPEGETACADGVDNDDDDLIDLADPGCSNAEDDDESNSGGGNGDEPQCNDGLDNDNDGRPDLDDDGCDNASDNDESNEEVSSSGGGGSGRKKGLVLGAEAPTVYFSCDQYLNTFIRSGRDNDMGQVARLQYFLNEFEGALLTVNGVYDAATLAAVNAFQVKYADEVLTPWGASQPTGFVYLTTRKKINELYCKGTNQFPLTAEEQQIIEQTRVGGTVSGTQTQVQPTLTVPTLEQIQDDASSETDASGRESANERETDGRPQRGFWGSVTDFFSGLFDGGN